MGAEYREVGPTGVAEAKDTNKYIGKSAHLCTTCGKEDAYMWIKYQRDEATDLECPRCDSMRTIPRGTEQMP